MFQNQTHEEEHRHGILWAPRHNINGGNPLFHWASMTQVRRGDIIFCIVRNAIVARAVAKDSAYEHKNPFENNLWKQEGWQLDVHYNFSIPHIRISDYIDYIYPYLPLKYSPFNSQSGRGNQGYLYPITYKFGQALDTLLSNDHINKN